MEHKLDKVEIEKIYRNDKNRDGKPYVSKKNNPFTKVDVFVTESVVKDESFEGKFSMFDFFGNTAAWVKGDKITGVLTKNGDYWNFELEKIEFSDSPERISLIAQRLAELETKINKMAGGQPLPAQAPAQDSEPDDDLPF